jgi:predicted NBD/HSP70 family sugar kinase
MSPLTLLRGSGERVPLLTSQPCAPTAPRVEHSYLLLHWDRHIASELILNAQTWVGQGAAGSIAHTLVKKDGAACVCGRRGCLQAYSSGLAMEERLRKLRSWGRNTRLADGASPRQWLEAAQLGDPLVNEVLQLATESMVEALDSVCRLLDLEAIVMDGEWGRALAGSSWLRPTSNALPPILLNRRGMEASAR